jgi:hypothetical protein
MYFHLLVKGLQGLLELCCLGKPATKCFIKFDESILWLILKANDWNYMCQKVLNLFAIYCWTFFLQLYEDNLFQHCK